MNKLQCFKNAAKLICRMLYGIVKYLGPFSRKKAKVARECFECFLNNCLMNSKY